MARASSGSAEEGPSQRCVVTGVDGSLGRAVAHELAGLRLDVVGWHPADRVAAADDTTTIPGVRVKRSPADDAAGLGLALQGASFIVHALIDGRPQADYDELAPLNLDLSRRLFEAARAEGVEAFVLLSHGRLYAPADRYVDEPGEVAPTDTSARSLHDVEILLRGLANRHPSGPRLVVLRRARLYGHAQPPSETPWWAVPPLLGLYFELVPGLAGGPRSQWLHAADLARAAKHLAQVGDLGQVSTFNVCDDTPLTLGEFLNVVIEGYDYPLGIKVPYPSSAFVRRLLPALERPVVRAAVSTVLARLWRAATDGSEATAQPDFAHTGLWGLADDLLLANDRLVATGFELAYPDARPGLRRTITTWRRQGLVPSEVRRGAAVESTGPALISIFEETMQGHVTLAGGASPLPIEFSVRLTASGPRLPVSDHTWNLDGQLTVARLTDGPTPIRGTLEVAPIGKRRLIYEFGFEGRDGRTFRLQGVKRIRLLNLKRSLTEMSVRILDQRGDEVASGEMSFDLRRDLLGFLRSFRVKRAGADGSDTGPSEPAPAGSSGARSGT